MSGSGSTERRLEGTDLVQGLIIQMQVRTKQE